jgi:hypothetical protein
VEKLDFGLSWREGKGQFFLFDIVGINNLLMDVLYGHHETGS